MLDRKNRVIRAADFRAAVRRGSRVSGPHSTVHILRRPIIDGLAFPAPRQSVNGQLDSRFGLVVTKSVGGAVVRNTVRRRLRSIGRQLLPEIGGGYDVVIRALPGSGEVPWVILHAEIALALRRRAARG